jgi:hypothetical protein
MQVDPLRSAKSRFEGVFDNYIVGKKVMAQSSKQGLCFDSINILDYKGRFDSFSTVID